MNLYSSFRLVVEIYLKFICSQDEQQFCINEIIFNDLLNIFNGIIIDNNNNNN